MKKKGSLSLSIEAIVIVVIAFVVLGLGLGFVKGIFGDIGGQSEQIFSTVEADIKDKMAQSNEPLYFPAQTLSLGVGEEKVNGVGVKNTGDVALQLKVVFQVRVGSEFIDFKSGDVMTLGTGEDAFEAGVFWDDSIQKYSPGESRPIPFTLTAPNKFGNYLFKVRVVKDDENDFASKTFFVRTS